jgi:voltage-gated potassium channel
MVDRRGRPDSPTYELFIAVLTIISIAVAVLVTLVVSPQVQDILEGTDTILCAFFLGDTFRSWWRAPSRSAYVFGTRPGRSLPTGIIDLFGSLPWFPPLRVLRLFRLDRARRVLRDSDPEAFLDDVAQHRAEAAAYIVAIAAILVMVLGSSLIALIEPDAPGSNIKTGGDAFWWTFVTITTVGYGDRYPVTSEGRLVGMITMTVGIGIFGVFTSFLAQFFLRAPARRFRVGGRAPEPPPLDASPRFSMPALDDDAVAEIRALRAELASLRGVIESGSGSGTGSGGPTG